MAVTGDEAKIGIPREMYERLQRKILGTSFGSVQDYVQAVLRQALGEGAIEGNRQGPGLSPADERKIKEKLKALGYM